MVTPKRIDGVDISHYQNGKIDYAKLKKAGVKWMYHKATEGETYVDPNFSKRRKEAKAAGLPFGAYHFARPNKGDAKKEAQFFIKTANPKVGDIRPALDLETSEHLAGAALVTWADSFCAEVKRLTGVMPIVYTPYSLSTKLEKATFFWRPRYNNGNTPPKEAWDIWQFSNGVYGVPNTVAGLGKCDLNTSKVALKDMLMPNSSSPAKPTKTVAQVAQEVIDGKWGNGATRVKKLKAAGYNADAVQKKVNDILKAKPTKTVAQVAQEVIDGKWGNGDTRIKKLKAAGYDPDTVQKKVNSLLKAKQITIRVTTANEQNFGPNLRPDQLKADLTKLKPISDLVLFQEMAEKTDFDNLIEVFGNTDWGNTVHWSECVISWKRAKGTIVKAESFKAAGKAPGKFSPPRNFTRLVLQPAKKALPQIEVIDVHFTNGAYVGDKRKDRIPYWEDCYNATKKKVAAGVAAGHIVIVGGDWNRPCKDIPKFTSDMVWFAGANGSIDGVAVIVPKGIKAEFKPAKTKVTPLNSDHNGRTRSLILTAK